MELRIARSALGDLQAIHEYYREQDVPQIGDGFVAAILEHCGMLQIPPGAGRVVPELSLDHIRELIHAPFRVVSLRQAKEVVLIRVWRLAERAAARITITKPCTGCQNLHFATDSTPVLGDFCKAFALTYVPKGVPLIQS